VTQGERGAPEALDADAVGGVPPTPAADAPKRAWRRWARALRAAWAERPERAVDEAAIAAHLARWPAWVAARTVLAYLPFGDEVAAPFDFAGKTVLTTRTDAGARRLTLHRADGPMEVHPLGFRQPPPEAPEEDPRDVDLVLVPGLAFDRRGGRLGYGRGLYDGLLPTLPPGAPRVAVAIEAWVVDRLPLEAHDVPVTHLLTPAGLRAVAR
jgi:5-formyltetrahydrofolate cyclo-ligase